MAPEQEQLKNERRLIDLLLKYPNGVYLAQIYEELAPTVTEPVAEVMRLAFSKSLIRREEGVYFSSPLGAASEESAAQIKSRIDKFNERYSRMPKSKAAKKAEARAAATASSQDDGCPAYDLNCSPDLVSTTSLPAKPIASLRPNSVRGRVAVVMLEHRDEFLTAQEVLRHLPKEDAGTLSRALYALARDRIEHPNGEKHCLLARVGRGEENASYTWSGHFSAPFPTTETANPVARPADSSVYKEQMQLLVELESLRSAALESIRLAHNSLGPAYNSLKALDERAKRVRAIIDSSFQHL